MQKFVALSSWLAIFALLQLRIIDDMDIFTQIMLGRQIIELGWLPTTETLCYTLHGTPLLPLGWLSQLGAALVERVGGLWGLHTLRSALYATALLVATTTSLSRCDGEKGPGLGVAGNLGLVLGMCGGFLAIMTSANLRAQAFAILCYVLLLRLAVSKMASGWKLAGSIVLGLLWQNSHPSLAAGVGTLLLLAGGRLLELYVDYRRRGAVVEGGSPSSSPPCSMLMPIFELFGIALLLGIMQICTPLGTRVFAISQHNYLVSATWLGISEWLPAWDPAVVGAMLWFWVLLVISLLYVVVNRQVPTITEWCIGVPITVLTLASCRFVLFWGVLMSGFWARWITTHGRDFSRPSVSRSWALASLLALFLCGIFLPVLLPPLERSMLPVAAIEELNASLADGPVYNYREWAGPMTFFAQRGLLQPAIDGRLYLFEQHRWHEYEEAARGRIPVAELTSSYSPAAFLLHAGYHHGLITLLEADPGWHKIFQKDQAVVFISAQQTTSEKTPKSKTHE